MSGRSQSGLTAKEILLLVAILSAVVAGLYPVIHARLDDYRVETAHQTLSALAGALERYKLDNHFYPTTEQGLSALVSRPSSQPTPRNWSPSGYLKAEAVPLDPWGNPYRYTSREEGRYYELLCLGADGKPGGEGLAADIAATSF